MTIKKQGYKMRTNSKLISAKEYLSICSTIADSYLKIIDRGEPKAEIAQASSFVIRLSHRLIPYTEGPSFFDEEATHCNHPLVQQAIEQLQGVNLYPEVNKFTLVTKPKMVKPEVAGKLFEVMGRMEETEGQKKMSKLIYSQLNY